MNQSTIYRIIAGLVLSAALTGIAFFAYQAWETQNLALDMLVSGNELPESTPEYSQRYSNSWMLFSHVWVLRCLGMLFLFFLILGAFRFLFWGPRWWGMHHYRTWSHHRPWSDWKPGEGLQSMFDEWHRKAHESGEGEKL